MLRHPITSEPLAAEIFNVHVFIGVLPRDMAFTGETDHLRTEKDKMFPRMDYRYAMSFYCSICEAHSKAQKHDALNYQTPDRIAEITLYNGTLPILKSSFIFRKNS